jgi:hypothetical protein
VQKTNAIAVVPLADPWAVRDLTICIRKLEELPLYARQLVEHLRSNSPLPRRRASAKAAELPRAFRAGNGSA